MMIETFFPLYCPNTYTKIPLISHSDPQNETHFITPCVDHGPAEIVDPTGGDVNRAD